MTQRTARLSRAYAIALSLLGVLGPACSDLPSVFEALPPEHLAIIRGSCMAGSSLRVVEGRKCEIEAEARDANDQVVVAGFSWSTGDQRIATVSPKPGFDTMIAEVSGVNEGETTLLVEVSGRPELALEAELTVLDSNSPDR